MIYDVIDMFYITEKKAYTGCAIVFILFVTVYMIFGNNININPPIYTTEQLTEYHEEKFIADIRSTNPQDIRDIYNISSNGITYNFSRYTSDGNVGWVLINIKNMSIINYSSELMKFDLKVFEKSIEKAKGDVDE